MSKEQPKYDIQLRNRASTALVLRVVVAGYLLYLVYKIISGAMGGDSPIPVWAVWLIGGAMAVAALAFLIYAWKRYRADMKAARFTEEEPEEQTDNGDSLS